MVAVGLGNFREANLKKQLENIDMSEVKDVDSASSLVQVIFLLKLKTVLEKRVSITVSDPAFEDAFVNVSNHSEEDQPTENDFYSLETDTNGLLTIFARLMNNYVQSLTDYKVSKLEQFKQQVLRVGEAG